MLAAIPVVPWCRSIDIARKQSCGDEIAVVLGIVHSNQARILRIGRQEREGICSSHSKLTATNVPWLLRHTGCAVPRI